MRIGFLVFNVDGMGGTSRSAVTQANALAPDHEITLLSVTRSADVPHYWIDPSIDVEHLVDVRDTDEPALEGVPSATATALHARESVLVPARWDRQFTALCDVAMERALPRLEVDVLVTVTPGLLAAAVELTPDRVVVVHQEHRSSSDRTSGLVPLLNFAPRADVVALLTPTIEEWLREQLGDLAPHTVVMPNPLPLGFTPRATLDAPLIMTAGRLVAEKQYTLLVDAFGQIADHAPEWRLRICGEGSQRPELVRQIRKWNLWDRVELPGSLPDMAGEWPKASIAALTSRAEGFPLVVQEAMAAGVPVASFDCPSGPREIIEHEVNGLLVAPQSVTGMAAALLRLTSDADLRRRLGRGALQTSRRYDAHAIAERWSAIFADARARRGDRARLDARANAVPPAAPSDPTAGVDVAGITPVRARHEALAWAVSAARAVGATWLVVPAHEHPTPTVVVPMTARDAFLDALAGDDCPAYLSLRDPAEHGWHERRGPVAALAADLRRGMTSMLHLEPWPAYEGAASVLGQGCGVEVQFWETSPQGDLVAPNRNAYTDRIPREIDTVEIEVDGVEARTLPLMAAPTVTECRFPVDVVYTWVDGNDPAWNAAREQRLAEVTDSTMRTRASSGRARFMDRGELRFSMRGLHLFAPWVRRIHVVTAGQVPPWIDPSHPMVNIVDHRDLLPPDALPTFNSHAIESVLHRIDGLAEHFLYFNDDFFVGAPTRPERWFGPAGTTAVFLSRRLVGLAGQDDLPYLNAAATNRRLLHGAFGATTVHTLAHAPYAHRVSRLAEIAERFAPEVDATTYAPFRSTTDVSMLSSLGQYYGLLTGTAYLADPDFAFVDITDASVRRRLRDLLRRERAGFCLGDSHDFARDPGKVDEIVGEFLEAYFPIAAPWER